MTRSLFASDHPPVVVIGGGPAGLMTADIISAAGHAVAVFDAMPSVGRKFLLAGVGGMNITHAEPFAQFVTRYREAQPLLEPLLRDFSADSLREWIHNLGIDTFVGSSKRVFPVDMKAAPLLRAWLHRLRGQGVSFFPRHRWVGWSTTKDVEFETASGERVSTPAKAVVLALGGGSWARLGSNGEWLPILADKNVSVAPLIPANSGFEVNWSVFMRERFAGEPLNTVSLSVTDNHGKQHHHRGECIVAGYGIEGSAVYALSAELRDQLLENGTATLTLDLTPDRDLAALTAILSRPRKGMSLSNVLRKLLKFPAVKAALLHECVPDAAQLSPAQLAAALKALPLILTGLRPLDEAISSAGGVRFESLDEHLMLTTMPGVFCAGEMLDWEAPTGGYLLTACFATGYRAGQGVLHWLNR